MEQYASDPSIVKKRRMSESRVNPHAPPPSRVVHARAVPDGTLSTDMAASLGQFGAISHIMLMPKLRQALIEFEAVDAAIRCVNDSKDSGVLIRERAVYFNFSKSQEINRGQTDDALPVNKVLLFTVQNALYPITCDVLHAICHPCGNVLRIVMVRKRGVQALVEFDTVEAAKKAKESLNFADIYAGCCTLKIEFSRTDHLNVSMNSDDTRDYTNNALPTRRESSGGLMGGQMQGQMGGYQQGAYGGQQQGGWGGAHMGQPGASEYMPRGSMGGGMPTMPGMQPAAAQQQQQMGYGAQPLDSYAMRRDSMGSNMSYGARGSIGYQGQMGGPMGGMGGEQMGGVPGSVIMFYELSAEYFNCQRLFNLVCLYANPIKVKFIINKPGMAMVQVDDPYAAQTVIQNLQGLEIFGSKIECGPSKHPYIADSRNMQRLADGSPHTLDCPRSLNHRFKNGQYNKGRLCKPTATLHFFNAPKDTPHDTYIGLFRKHGAPIPKTLLTFKDDGKPSDRGLIQFATEQDAVNALALANHNEIGNAAGRVYTIKFSFSLQEIDTSDPTATRTTPESMGGLPPAAPGAAAAAGLATAPPAAPGAATMPVDGTNEVAFAASDFQGAPEPSTLPVPMSSDPV